LKALILWAEPESTNLGVRVLALGSARLLEKSFADVEVSYQGFGDGDAPVRIGAPRAQIRRLVSRHDELVDWLREFDLVVDTRAGDSFADIYGQRRLLVMTLMAEIIAKAGVPLVLGPQTIGPFVTRRGRTMARRSLRAARRVMARDPVSADQASGVGRPVDIVTTDVVFALDPVAARGRRDVLVNPSGLLWSENGHVNADAYRTVIRGICRSVLAQGRKLSLVAHVLDSPLRDNDVPVVRALGKELGDEVEVLVPTDLAEARSMISSAEVVIGSRMHACLNALSVGRPAIPLAYSRKFDPLLRHIGWDKTVDLRADPDPITGVLRALDAPDLTSRIDPVLDRAGELLGAARSTLSCVLR
jgi:colanic acid/amylovoran biosynthesis protein